MENDRCIIQINGKGNLAEIAKLLQKTLMLHGYAVTFIRDINGPGKEFTGIEQEQISGATEDKGSSITSYRTYRSSRST